MISHIRRIFVLLVVLVLTGVLWVAVSAFAYAMFIHFGASFGVHYGIATPDLVNYLPFLLAALVVGRFSLWLYGGSGALAYLAVSLLLFALLFLGVDGAFVSQNWHHPQFLGVRLPMQLAYAAILVLLGFLISPLCRRKKSA